MNLHGIASAAVAAVNPMQPVIVRVSLGFGTDDSGRQIPYYGPPQTVMGQVQPLTGGELRHMDALNLQGDFIGIYLAGHIDGLVRSEHKGGDLITLANGTPYLVTQVLESWPDWCKVVCTRQNKN